MIMFWVSLQAVSRLLCVLLSGLDLGDRNLIEGRPRALHPPPRVGALAKAPSVQSHICPHSAGMALRAPSNRMVPTGD
jgi:hypothetical protein